MDDVGHVQSYGVAWLSVPRQPGAAITKNKVSVSGGWGPIMRRMNYVGQVGHGLFPRMPYLPHLPHLKANRANRAPLRDGFRVK